MDAFPNQEATAIAARITEQIDERDKQNLAIIEKQRQDIERLKTESADRDRVYRERLAVYDSTPSQAIQNLEQSFATKPLGTRNGAAEADMIKATSLFGKGSDSRGANALALRDFAEYKRLKKVATALGRL